MSLTPTPVAGGGILPSNYYFALKNDPGLNQTLSLSSNTLSISGGNSVNIADATTVSTSAVKLTAQSYVAGFNATNFTSKVISEGVIQSSPPLGNGSAVLNGGLAEVTIGATVGNPKVVFEKAPAPNAAIDYDGTNINMSSLHVSTCIADTALLSTVQLGYEVLDSLGNPGSAGQVLQSSGAGLPVVWGAGVAGAVTAVVGGSNINVDSTNPIAPVVNLSTSISIPSSITCSTINGVNPALSLTASDSVQMITPNTALGVNETAAAAYIFAPNEVRLSTATFNLINNDSNSVSFNLGNFAVIGSAQVGGSGVDGISRVYDSSNDYHTDVYPSSITFNSSNVSLGTEVAMKFVEPYQIHLVADDSALPAKIIVDGQNGAMRLQAAINDAQINFNSVNGGSLVDGIKISTGDNPGRVEISTNRILLQTAQNGGDWFKMDIDSSLPQVLTETPMNYLLNAGTLSITTSNYGGVDINPGQSLNVYAGNDIQMTATGSIRGQTTNSVVLGDEAGASNGTFLQIRDDTKRIYATGGSNVFDMDGLNGVVNIVATSNVNITNGSTLNTTFYNGGMDLNFGSIDNASYISVTGNMNTTGAARIIMNEQSTLNSVFIDNNGSNLSITNGGVASLSDATFSGFPVVNLQAATPKLQLSASSGIPADVRYDGTNLLLTANNAQTSLVVNGSNTEIRGEAVSSTPAALVFNDTTAGTYVKQAYNGSYELKLDNDLASTDYINQQLAATTGGNSGIVIKSEKGHIKFHNSSDVEKAKINYVQSSNKLNLECLGTGGEIAIIAGTDGITLNSAGDLILSGAALASGSAGGNSGNHLRIKLNGVFYKISLLND